MEDKEKKEANLLKDELLESVTGGKSQPTEGTCPYCGQYYTNGYQAHKKDCTASQK